MLTLDTMALTVAGLLVGNEFAIAASVHPTLNRLPDHAHAAGASALARLLGRVMPFWLRSRHSACLLGSRASPP